MTTKTSSIEFQNIVNKILPHRAVETRSLWQFGQKLEFPYTALGLLQQESVRYD